jgi:hypothetical protein
VNLGERIQPTPNAAVLSDPDHFIWGGSMIRDEGGTCHLLYSRWPRDLGHGGWVTHSEVAHAVAEDPLGPYEHVDVALPERGADYWDGHDTHNPTVERFGDRYYLYYTGNVGDRRATDGLNFTHRNNQRIGVAVADHPAGPWTRFDEPLVDSTPGFHDALCCNNPSATRRPDGSFLFVYKAVADDQDPPYGGPVRHVVATADDPTGPVEKHPEPVFTAGGADFPAEDPYVWRGDERYWAVVKDQGGHFTGAGESLALFDSRDGIDWSPADSPLVSTRRVEWADGTSEEMHSLERPQLWCDDGDPAVLFCAANRTAAREHSFNVHLPLEVD